MLAPHGAVTVDRSVSDASARPSPSRPRMLARTMARAMLATLAACLALLACSRARAYRQRFRRPYVVTSYGTPYAPRSRVRAAWSVLAPCRVLARVPTALLCRLARAVVSRVTLPTLPAGCLSCLSTLAERARLCKPRRRTQPSSRYLTPTRTLPACEGCPVVPESGMSAESLPATVARTSERTGSHSVTVATLRPTFKINSAARNSVRALVIMVP